MNLKSENSNEDIVELETQIDNIIYNLYNLTDDEISIIENN